MLNISGRSSRSMDDELEQYRARRQDELDREPETVPGTGPRKAYPAGTVRRKPPEGGARIFAGSFGVLALLCFAATFLCGVAFMDTLSGYGLEWAVPALLGATFLLMGLAAWLSGNGRIPLLFSAAGAAVLALSLAYGLGGEWFRAAFMDKIFAVIVCAVFVAAGLGIGIVPKRIEAARAARYTVRVDAQVAKKTRQRMRMASERGTNHRMVYVLTWTYFYDGQEYQYLSNIGRNPEPRVPGDRGVLYLDPDDAGSVWEGPMAAPARILLAVLGGAMAAMGGIAMIAALLIF